MLSILKSISHKILPKAVFNWYHSLLAIGSACWYGFPSRKLIIIGVTGTKGKTTVSNLLCFALNELGQSCGLISTAVIKIGHQSKLNDLKMTMPGRFALQRYLRDMVCAKNKYVVVETSSEGLSQGRHLGIWYDAAIFTNLTPEHIESHGSFENYTQAKLKLWQAMQGHYKNIAGRKISKISVVNSDDQNAQLFINNPSDQLYLYGLNEINSPDSNHKVLASQIKSSPDEISFTVVDEKFILPIGGEFNIYNTLASISYLLSQNFTLTSIASALKKFSGTPGRMEYINEGQSFKVVVDYAHTAESLQKVYDTFKKDNRAAGKLIAVLGSCGGGRDKAKRPILGKIAGCQADYVVVTNEDPYDEDPGEIIKSVAGGVQTTGKKLQENLFIIEDRRRAIAYALGLASSEDVVIITGKGSEQWLVTSNGKVPWDDRRVAREELIKKITK